MALEGIKGNQPVNNKHTMESLNIKKDSNAASIFNEIDKLDGKEDGYLTDDQYFVYRKRISIAYNKEDEMKVLEQKEKELKDLHETLNIELDIKKRYPDASFDDRKKTITINSLRIYNFDISTPERFQILKIEIAERESINKTINNL